MCTAFSDACLFSLPKHGCGGRTRRKGKIEFPSPQFKGIVQYSYITYEVTTCTYDYPFPRLLCLPCLVFVELLAAHSRL